MKINILGTEYTVLRQNAEQNPKMENCDGIHEPYSKKIIIDTDIDSKDKMVVENVDEYHHKVLRHEAFHAIFAEAGFNDYWNDEVLVEALARLYPKIKVIMEQLDNTDLQYGNLLNG